MCWNDQNFPWSSQNPWAQVSAVKMRIDTWSIEPGPQAPGHSCYCCVHWLHFKLTVFTIDQQGRNGPGHNRNKSDKCQHFGLRSKAHKCRTNEELMGEIPSGRYPFKRAEWPASVFIFSHSNKSWPSSRPALTPSRRSKSSLSSCFLFPPAASPGMSMPPALVSGQAVMWGIRGF